MGGKASNNFQSDRPESGGADRDMIREKSGLLDRDKERFAAEQARRDANARADSEARTPASFNNTSDDEPNPESRED